MLPTHFLKALWASRTSSARLHVVCLETLFVEAFEDRQRSIEVVHHCVTLATIPLLLFKLMLDDSKLSVRRQFSILLELSHVWFIDHRDEICNFELSLASVVHLTHHFLIIFHIPSPVRAFLKSSVFIWNCFDGALGPLGHFCSFSFWAYSDLVKSDLILDRLGKSGCQELTLFELAHCP